MADVDIVNRALLRVGANTITSLTPPITSDAQRLGAAFYLPTLKRLLRSYNWGFAKFRKELEALAVTPVDLADNFPSSYYYPLPTDPFCEVILATNLDDLEPWQTESYTNVTDSTTTKVLVTNATSVNILYVGLVTDTSLFDDLFSYLFETDLAYQFSYPLTRNAQLSAEIKAELQACRQQARSRDGQEQRMLRKFNSSTLTRVR